VLKYGSSIKIWVLHWHTGRVVGKSFKRFWELKKMLGVYKDVKKMLGVLKRCQKDVGSL